MNDDPQTTELSRRAFEALGDLADAVTEQASSRLMQVAEAKRESGQVAARPPHIAELYKYAIQGMGGPEAYGAHFGLNFRAAPRGSATRQRMLSDAGRMGVKVTELGLATLKMSEMSDEQLRETAHTLFVSNYEPVPDDDASSDSAEAASEVPAEAGSLAG